MLKLSKKIEYGIQALQYMANNTGSVISAKEISEQLNIPFDFLSKTLQVLNKNGIILSQQGIKGGYILARDPKSTTIAEIIRALEENASIVDCLETNEENCNRIEYCTIKNPMNKLQEKINLLLNNTTIAEFSEVK